MARRSAASVAVDAETLASKDFREVTEKDFVDFLANCVVTQKREACPVSGWAWFGWGTADLDWRCC